MPVPVAKSPYAGLAESRCGPPFRHRDTPPPRSTDSGGALQIAACSCRYCQNESRYRCLDHRSFHIPPKFQSMTTPGAQSPMDKEPIRADALPSENRPELPQDGIQGQIRQAHLPGRYPAKPCQGLPVVISRAVRFSSRHIHGQSPPIAAFTCAIARGVCLAALRTFPGRACFRHKWL